MTFTLKIAFLFLLGVKLLAVSAMADEPPMQDNLDLKNSLTDSWPSPVDDQENHAYFLVDLLEHRWTDAQDDALRWDVFGWYGGDRNRLWVKSEGRQSTSTNLGYAEVQALYGRLISPFIDLQVGVRHDLLWEDGSENSRSFGVVGFQGLAPYRFEIEPIFYISQDGDLSARFTGTYDFFLTQRLIIQPRIEGNAALQEVKSFGIGSGLNDSEIGLRLRYEISREFAPYIGVTSGRSFGGTASIVRAEGREVSESSLVAGVRMWF